MQHNDVLRRIMMSNEILDRPQVTAGSAFNQAEVIGLSDGQNFLIRFLDDPAEREFSATSALENPAGLQPGDQVLVAGTDPQALYIIGVLSARRAAAMPSTALLPGGGSAEIPYLNSSEPLRIFSPAGDLLLEYNSASGQIRLNAGAGGIEFASAQGDITFCSGKQIRMEGQSVAVRAQHSMDFGIVHTLRGMLARLHLTGDGTVLRAPNVTVETAHCDLQLNETTLKSEVVQADIGKIKVKSRRAEFSTETLITRAKNVYQTIEELCQLCSGRLRMIVRGTWHSRSQNTHLQTREDFKVKADQIHLG
jgi:hypothetical protein